MVAGFYFMGLLSKRTKLLIGGLCTSVFLLVGSLTSYVTFTGLMSKASANISNQADFTYTYNGNVFVCYHRESLPGEVEIGWGGNVETQMDNLSVPETVTHENVDYTVTAVVQGGFRYCQFKTIDLPDTITHIEEESFAYCTRMEKFVLPYGVTEIKASTFIDCRAMVNFFYKDATGNVVVTNDKVTSIGDHAFDSCISLTDFTCSTVLTNFGTCCFQNVDSISHFYFPSKTGTGENINNITVGSYAFADCDSLSWVYFESNLHEVDDFAFANSNTNMVLHYGYEGTYPGDPTYSAKWRRKQLASSVTTNFPIESDHIVILQSNEYPGLKYTIENTDRYLDCQLSNTPAANKIKIINGSDGKYAVIYEWKPPVITIPNYYNITTKALEIPGSLTFDGVSYPLKVIKAETFANRADDISTVKFNSGLVQICQRAFYKCNKITNLDFSSCDTLIEISNAVFNHKNSGTVNDVMTTLTLPNSIQYLGSYAFFGFRNVQELSLKTNQSAPGNLKAMGGYVFGRIGEKYTEPKISVTLPCTLNDADAVKANINKADGDYNDVNWAGISAYCFGAGVNNQYTAIKTITMEKCTHPEHANYKCSLAPNAFNRAKYLTKFVASDNLFLVGNEVFKNCESIREIFLTTGKAAASGYPIPFGCNDAYGSNLRESIVSGASNSKALECVIYLDGDAPGHLANGPQGESEFYPGVNGKDKNVDRIGWNSEKSITYQTDFGYTSGGTNTGDYKKTHSRKEIPTCYNTDFDFDSGSILYYKPSTKTFLTEAPSTLTDYKSGIIVLAKAKNASNYTIVRYFTDDSHITKEIDLSKIVHPTLGNISSYITTIGPEAFARADNGNKTGYYFILPDTVTKIDERAFFHRADNSKAAALATNGVRIVTYRNLSTDVISPTTSDYNTAKSFCESNDNNDTNRLNIAGYCQLPSGLTYIGRNAFYNNLFGSANIPANVAFLGNGAFYSQPNTSGNTIRSKLDSSSITFSNSNFEFSNGGIYYKNAPKMLVYQTQNNTGTLEISSGTKAVAMGGCAGTGYSKIKINSEMTHIYGSAFQYSRKLTEVEGGIGLQYISAHSPGEEVYSTSMPFDNFDYRKRYDGDVYANIAANVSAFQDCNALTTINLKAMTSLKKIGNFAFRNCTNLQYLTGGASYSYYSYSESNGTPTYTLIETKTDSVMDLSGCTNLISIGQNSFSSSKIGYVHLPFTNGYLYTSRDPDAEWFDNNTNQKIFSSGTPKFLVGDTANLANANIAGTTAKSRGRYTTSWYGSSEVYYHVSQASDILNNSVVQVKYWTEKPGGGYILFQNQANAESYFN